MVLQVERADFRRPQMAFCRHLHLALILIGTCVGSNEDICKKGDCSESIRKCKKPFEERSLVEETPYMISPEDFYYKFMAKHKPIVIRKAASNWPAIEVHDGISYKFL